MVLSYRRRLWLLVLLLATPLVAAAQADSESEAGSTLRLQPITVLGTRTAKAPDEVPRSIDVIERDEISREQATAAHYP